MIKLYGKKELLRRLADFRRSGRFPHALLLHGDNGVGKLTVARYIAQLYLCDDGGDTPCGACNQCRRIENDIHPDVLFAKRSCKDGKYSVGSMREITEKCCYRPNDGEARVIIFEDMHEMRPDCQNALLKFIEEPLTFNRYVFTADSVSSILPTISSRVVALPVTDVSCDECSAALAELGIPADSIPELVGLYGGNIGRCMDGYGDESGQKLFAIVRSITSGIATKNEFLTASAFAQLSTRDMQRDGLLLLQSAVGDAMKHSVGGGNASGATAELARALPLKKLYAMAELLSEAIRKCDFNPNIQLASMSYAGRIFQIIG